MSIRKIMTFTAALFLSASATSVWAAEAFMVTKVSQVITGSSDWLGSCGARLTDSLASSTNLMGCTDWVTFNCAGANGGSKANAQRMFDAAQLAFVTDRRVRITVTDDPTMKMGVACMATRLYVMGN